MKRRKNRIYNSERIFKNDAESLYVIIFNATLEYKDIGKLNFDK